MAKQHDVEIVWEVAGGAFTAGAYSRRHQWRFDGGQAVVGSSSPHVVREPLSDPFGVDPEEALVASVSSCHMLWFLDLARHAGLDVASYRDPASGELGRIDEQKFAVTRIALRPDIAFVGRQPTAQELAALHRQAHERCFIANSIKAEIVIEASEP